MKLERHSASRHKHAGEIALGMALGPHSDAYRYEHVHVARMQLSITIADSEF